MSRLSWEDLSSYITQASSPQTYALDGLPAMHLYFDPGLHRLGLRMPPGSEDLPVTPLAQLEIERRPIGEETVIDIWATNDVLWPYVHAFAITVADRVQVDGLDPAAAVSDGLARFADLLQRAAVLSPESELGLIGELWLLQRLTPTLGPQFAVDAWTGPTRQAHDARFGALEIEVKATKGERRIHQISSVTQLVASEGRSLYLLSLQFTMAGPAAGLTLGEAVAAVQAGLGEGGPRKRFDALLTSAHGLDLAALDTYSTRYQLRTKPYLVPVSEGFPRLTPESLSTIADTTRITDVRYRIDVEGLGFEDGSAPFLEVLPKENS